MSASTSKLQQDSSPWAKTELLILVVEYFILVNFGISSQNKQKIAFTCFISFKLLFLQLEIEASWDYNLKYYIEILSNKKDF